MHFADALKHQHKLCVRFASVKQGFALAVYKNIHEDSQEILSWQKRVMSLFTAFAAVQALCAKRMSQN
jgi:hypothetical protein